MDRLKEPANIFRAPMIGLCTVGDDGYVTPFDQTKGLTGRNCGAWIDKVENTPGLRPVKLKRAWSNHHFTQRRFFRAMAAVNKAFGKRATKYRQWTPEHVR